MKNSYFLFTILLILHSSCFLNKQIDASKPIPTITITNIECVNLSEDMSRLSTHEDEVLIKIDLLKLDKGKCEIVKNVYEEVHTFTKRGELCELDKTITITNEMDELLVLLIELDETNNEESVIEIADSLMLAGVFINEEIDPIKIDSLFGYNDFLGISRIPLQEGFLNKINKNTIKGLQLFDRYEYGVHWDVK